MTNSSRQSLDTSGELHIQRYSNGIQLVRPREQGSQGYITVANMLNMPFNVYFLNSESMLQKTNDSTAITCGFESADDAIGRSVREVAAKETADHLIRQDRTVIETQSMNISSDNYSSLYDTDHVAISLKFPWYSHRKLVGIFGCSIVASSINHDLAHAISLLIPTGLLNAGYLTPPPTFNVSDFSKRELHVLHYLVEGKSTREIAAILGISTRTVEHHLEKAKHKTKTTSKCELLSKIIKERLV